MNNKFIMNTNSINFEEILIKGANYYPAINRKCDRCQKAPLLGSIRYEDKDLDLCYLCAHAISKSAQINNIPEPIQTQNDSSLTFMEQNQFKIRMIQRQYK